MIDSRIASGWDGVWKTTVIRSDIRSRAELNCALLAFVSAPFTPTRYRAQTRWYRSRLRARRRFGYWGKQIGHLRDQSGHHFEARRQNLSLQPRVGAGTAMENIESTGRPAADRWDQHQDRGSSPSPLPSAGLALSDGAGLPKYGDRPA